MNRVLQFILIVLGFGMLAGVRYFQESLFYDPLLLFFKSNYSTAQLPELIVPKYYIHLTFRYLLNAVLSLAILWLLFKKWEIVKFSAVIYLLFFLVLIPLMIVFVDLYEVGNYQTLFYVRRFLIQPLLLLLLIPAFYFVKK